MKNGIVAFAVLLLIASFGLLFQSGCGSSTASSTSTATSTAPKVSVLQKIENGIEVAISDIKTIDKGAATVLPAVTAVAEVLAPGSTTAIDLTKASTVVTKSAGAVQSFTLTFPPPVTSTGTAAVLQTVQAASNVAAQIAPQATTIIEAAVPGSTAGLDMMKASTKITTANGIIQNLVITPPAPVAAPPATSTGN